MFANMLNPQSLNLYSHALNSPLVFIDIDGLELVRAVLSNGQTVVVDRSIAGDLMSFVDEAQAAGLRVTITSGFRTQRHQQAMHDAWVRNGRHGNPVAETSSHTSGQSVDISTRGMNAAQLNQLGAIGRRHNLPYAGSRDTVHFGRGWDFPMDQSLYRENNANPNPDSTIVDGGVTTVNVTDTATTVDVDNNNMVPTELTPIDLEEIQLPEKPVTPPPPPPPPAQ